MKKRALMVSIWVRDDVLTDNGRETEEEGWGYILEDIQETLRCLADEYVALAIYESSWGGPAEEVGG